MNTLEKRNNKNSRKKKSINDFSLTKIGTLIKETRIGRNQSINELASILKISEQQLKAIEEGREDLLPEKVFVRAMIKRISEKLRIDIPIMGEFERINKSNTIEEVEVTPQVEIQNKSATDDLENTKEKQNPFFFILVVIISGLVGLSTSSLIFNIISESLHETNKEELIKQN